MGRKSKLTEGQWDEVERRHFVDGEAIRRLADEFHVDEACVRRKINPRKAALLNLAEKKAQAEKQVKRVSQEIEALPPRDQQLVVDLATAMTRTSEYLASAAEASAETSALLARMARDQVKKIAIGPDADPQANTDTLRAAMSLQAGANEASSIGLRLLTATKGAAPEPPPMDPTADMIPDDPIAAAKTYRRMINGGG